MDQVIELSDQFIRDYYDANIDITMSQLSTLTGYTVEELKKILMGDK